MFLIEIVLIGLTLWGTTALWLKVFDHLHSRALPRWALKTGNVITLTCLSIVPVALAVWYLRGETRLVDLVSQFQVSLPLLYIVLCWVLALWTAPQLLRRHRPDTVAVLISNHTTRADLYQQLGDRCVADPLVRFAARLPGNHLLQLLVHHEQVRVPRLPAALEGLSITHLSDLHFTGKIAKPFFDEIVRRANDLQSDLIAVTGDIVDRDECLDWLPDTLGRLEAPHGVYFVLGNHDRKHHASEIRQRLTGSGLVDLGSRWLALTIQGREVILAGNELPWFSPPADLQDCPSREPDGPMRILLAHSPDQFRWARRHDFDFMLAGHTHGGQIHLPWTGPIVSASRMGTDYAAGLIYEPPTVLHVSRGLSQTIPLRFGCPPELARLELHRHQSQDELR